MTERHVLEIRRSFDAPPEAVFQAFADPELLREWAAPGEHRTEEVEMTFEVGGTYRRRMRFPDGTLHVLAGEYLAIERPRRLVYTYRWETIPGTPETRVEIEIRPSDRGSDLLLRHRGLEPGEMADDHRSGWSACFDQLARLLQERVHGGGA